jgi:glycine oxidase
MPDTPAIHFPENARVLIVGQGIAGTHFAWQLHQHRIPFHIIDPGQPMTASKVSSGLINPVTGRYFAKSWRIDELLPLALDSYHNMQDALGAPIFKMTRIQRALYSVAQENEWSARANQKRFEPYIGFWTEQPPWPTGPEVVANGRIEQVVQVDKPALLNGLRNKWIELGKITEETLDYEKLVPHNDYWHYNGQNYSHVVFAEGSAITGNPFFDWVPIEPTKGEAFIIEMADAPEETILKHHCFVVPLGNQQYWAGSNYEKHPASPAPSPKEQAALQKKLEASVQRPYTILHNMTGVRPASPDRRAIVGAHPEYSGLYVLNGMGTKGALLAPFCSQQLLHHMFNHKALDQEIDALRWWGFDR